MTTLEILGFIVIPWFVLPALLFIAKARTDARNARWAREDAAMLEDARRVFFGRKP